MKEKTLRGAMSTVAIGLVALLSGCSNLDLLNSKGSVGIAERNLIATSTWAMLIVVIPVIAMTLLFAWRYRASNKSAEYRPTWSHSTGIEIAIWTIPTLIILFLGVLTWKSTHELDPYRPLEWKWLFIYPDLGIASVNQLALPVGTPVNFNITSDSVMNSFFIPQLGGQIYAMAGMQTKLHLIADEPGDYAGESANFSGKGFSDMKFRAIASSPEEFNAWVAKVRASSDRLDMNRYNVVSQPGEKAPVTYFSSVDPKLFHNIIARYNNGNVMDMKDDSNCKAKG
jgi:cytochrome o ubiquinol oxidase subunit 2